MQADVTRRRLHRVTGPGPQGLTPWQTGVFAPRHVEVTLAWVRNLQMLGIRMLENGGSYPDGQTAYQGEQAFNDRQFLTVAGKAGLTGEEIRGEMTRIAADPAARFQEGKEVLFEAAKLMRNLNPEEQSALLRRLASN